MGSLELLEGKTSNDVKEINFDSRDTYAGNEIYKFLEKHGGIDGEPEENKSLDNVTANLEPELEVWLNESFREIYRGGEIAEALDKLYSEEVDEDGRWMLKAFHYLLD